jgi:hypothetical protein
MATQDRNAILGDVDELYFELRELAGVLAVCRSAAIEPGDAPDSALPDALSAAARALARIEERAKRIGKAALAST